MVLKPNFLLQCGPLDKSLPTGLIVMMPFIELVCWDCGCSIGSVSHSFRWVGLNWFRHVYMCLYNTNSVGGFAHMLTIGVNFVNCNLKCIYLQYIYITLLTFEKFKKLLWFCSTLHSPSHILKRKSTPTYNLHYLHNTLKLFTWQGLIRDIFPLNSRATRLRWCQPHTNPGAAPYAMNNGTTP